MLLEMTPGEVRNARWAAVSSLVFHILILLLMVALEPHTITRTGLPLNYVRVGVVEIETARPAPPQTPKQGTTSSETTSRVQVVTKKESPKAVKAESSGEEEYNPADYPGDHEAGIVLASPIVTPKTIQNLGLTGTVEMLVTVDSDGSVAKVKVTKSSGNDTVDESAVKIARRLAYEPKVYKGQKVRGTIKVTCRLEPEKTYCETAS